MKNSYSFTVTYTLDTLQFSFVLLSTTLLLKGHTTPMMEHSLSSFSSIMMLGLLCCRLWSVFSIVIIRDFSFIIHGGGKLQRAGGYLSVKVIVSICYTSRTAQILTQETTFSA